jgi:hypothetical protein
MASGPVRLGSELSGAVSFRFALKEKKIAPGQLARRNFVDVSSQRERIRHYPSATKLLI